MGNSTLLGANSAIGGFQASSGYFGSQEAKKQARYNHTANVRAAGINYTEQDNEFNRQLFDLGADERDDTSIFVREAKGRLATLRNSVGVLDWSTRNHLYLSEEHTANIEIGRVSNNYDRDREAVRAGKRANVSNYRNAVVGSSNVRTTAVLRARQQATQSLINGASTVVGGYGDYT